MTDFSVTPSSLSLLGSAKPTIPCDAYLLDPGRHFACLNFRNFTLDELCYLAS